MASEPKIAGSIRPLHAAAVMVVLGVSVVWSLWPMLCEMALRWTEDPTYSHGYLVPVFAAGLLWFRRQELAKLTLRPNVGWGMALVAAGASLQLLGTYTFVRWVIGVSLIVYLIGGCVLIGGWPLLRWTWPALAFLVFMIPLPWRFESLMRSPMRRTSTVASAYVLRTLGLPALDQGNVIHIDEHQIGIVEACSGLKMLITFFAFSTAVVLVIKRPLVDKILIVLSTVPIAMISNVVRITATGLLDVTVGDRIGDLVFHDLAGWFMMPVGLALLWLELKLLDHLFLEEPEESPRGPISPLALAGVLIGPATSAPSGPRRSQT
jgi:exosortase